MRNPSRQRFILIAIGFLALILCLWIIRDGPKDGSSITTNRTPQTTSDDGAPDSVSMRNQVTERARVRFETPGSTNPEEVPPNRRRLPPSGGSEKRRPVQSTIAGIVANSQDGTPIPDARVRLSALGSAEVPLEAFSAHDGRFQMTIHNAGRYMLHAVADGFQPYFIDRLLITPTQGSLQKNILMTPEVELRGRVVDRHSRGIAKASVWLREETERGFSQSFMAQTEESGFFRTDRAPPSGTYFVEAAHPEYELDSPVPVTLPRDDEVVVTMRRVPDTLMASLSGHVRDADGRPIQGAEVRLKTTESWGPLLNGLGHSSTDPTGRFFFPRVRRGKYQVMAYATGYARQIYGRGIKDVTVDSNGENEIDLVLENQTRVHGVVLNPDGLPLADAQVRVRWEMGSGSTAIGVGTSTDGTFDISGIPPGRHQIQATHSDYVSYESGVVTPTDDFFTITLHAGLSLTGYVVDQNNEPIRGFSLRLSPATGQHYDKLADVSPADGYFSVKGLSPQTYILSVDQPNADGRFTRFELLESTSVTIMLNLSDSGSRIRVRNYW